MRSVCGHTSICNSVSPRSSRERPAGPQVRSGPTADTATVWFRPSSLVARAPQRPNARRARRGVCSVYERHGRAEAQAVSTQYVNTYGSLIGRLGRSVDGRVRRFVPVGVRFGPGRGADDYTVREIRYLSALTLGSLHISESRACVTALPVEAAQARSATPRRLCAPRQASDGDGCEMT